MQSVEALIQYIRAELWRVGINTRVYAPPKLDFIPPKLQQAAEALTICSPWP